MGDIQFAIPIARSVRYAIAMPIKLIKAPRIPKAIAIAISEAR
jgi:hypothetical protein